MVINGFTPSEEIFKKDILEVHKGDKNRETKGLEKSFGESLKMKLDEVNNVQVKAEKAQEAFIKGEDVDIHEVMLSSQEAKLSLQFAVEVRNKVVEAYQEITRMQI